MQDLVSFLPLIAIVLIFWLLIIRPQAKRQRELVRMQSSLSVGDKVVLASGIHGTVTATEDATTRVEIAPGVTVTVARGAIGQVLESNAANHHDNAAHTEPGSEES